MVDTSARPKVQSLLALFDQKDDQKPNYPPLTSTKPLIKPKPTLQKNPSFLEDLSFKISDNKFLLKSQSEASINSHLSSNLTTTKNQTSEESISHEATIKPSGVIKRNPSFLQDLTNKIKNSSNEDLVKPSKLISSSQQAPTGAKEENKLSILESNSLADKLKKLARKKIPPESSLGPAPDKPSRPESIKLPIATRTLPNIPKRKAPPVPKANEVTNLLEQDLYQDAALIPEYTEEEEAQDEELYNDTSQPPLLPPLNNRNIHLTLQPPLSVNEEDTEEIYQDVILTEFHEEMYEIMPCDQTPSSFSLMQQEVQRNEYRNIKEREEKLKKEQKELKKREKEVEKMKKKFGITEELRPVDAGLVKVDHKGGRNDLEVYRGETVLILRMENNPTGKWLAKSEKGKIGYVDLTNLEVDAGSVKSVMKSRRNSKINEEPLYNDTLGGETEEESIYEVPY